MLFPVSYRNLLPLIFVTIFGTAASMYAGDFKVLPNAQLATHSDIDGDSLEVSVSGSKLHIRLYFVDCPEITAASKTDARRVREQTRYFGLSHPVKTIHYGKAAKDFVINALSKPFTVYTSYANALGRSSKGRVYAFVTTAEGDDLASLLVKKGLARAYGVGRKTPDGIPKHEMKLRLIDLETSAMLKRIGIWSESDAERIAELRAKQRREDEKIKNLQRQLREASQSIKGVDPNIADKTELESIPGIGPTIADRIIAGRPCNSIIDLLKVKGIGPKKLEDMRSYIFIGSEASSQTKSAP